MKIACRSNRYSSGYEEVHGHGCTTRKEMDSYANQFGFEVVVNSFDFGVPVQGQEQFDWPWGKPVTEARRNAMRAVLAAMDALPKNKVDKPRKRAKAVKSK